MWKPQKFVGGWGLRPQTPLASGSWGGSPPDPRLCSPLWPNPGYTMAISWTAPGGRISSYATDSYRPEVTNMRPAKEFPAAREHFGETSTFKHFFPV